MKLTNYIWRILLFFFFRKLFSIRNASIFTIFEVYNFLEKGERNMKVDIFFSRSINSIIRTIE